MAKKATYFDYLRQEMGELIDQLDLSDFQKQSLKQRWLDQVIWADKKADQCRRAHYRLRVTTIVGGVILPALVGLNFQLGKDNEFLRNWFPYVPFVLSQVIAVSVAAEEFFKYGDRWRDYRQLSEDLKAEGWQFMQLSGTYQYKELQFDMVPPVPRSETPIIQFEDFNSINLIPTSFTRTTHKESFRRFTGQVEALVKNDVSSYITALQQKQAQETQQVQQIVSQATAVIDGKNPYATSDASSNVSVNGSSNGSRYAQPMAQQSITPQSITPQSTAQFTPQFTPIDRSSRPDLSSLITPTNNNNSPVTAALPLPLVPVAPPSALLAPPIAAVALSSPTVPVNLPAENLSINAKILAAANQFRGTSTADGPDGGNNACGWSLHQVLQIAGISAIGSNPNLVPAIAETLANGRGKKVTSGTAKAGDLVIAFEEAHIGIALTDGCTRVLSNSSSRACFSWESDQNFDGSYGGLSTIYRLLS